MGRRFKIGQPVRSREALMNGRVGIVVDYQPKKRRGYAERRYFHPYHVLFQIRSLGPTTYFFRASGLEPLPEVAHLPVEDQVTWARLGGL